MSEKWVQINGYEGLYDVSDAGNVRSRITGIVLKPYRTGKGEGYLTVDLHINGKSKNKKIHRLVAEAFIPNPEEKPEVNHIDGDKTNNNVSNLEWCTGKENCTHAAETGLIQCGERRASAKLTSEQVAEIRQTYERGCLGRGAKSLARKYGVSDVTIRRIISGRKWKHETN